MSVFDNRRTFFVNEDVMLSNSEANLVTSLHAPLLLVQTFGPRVRRNIFLWKASSKFVQDPETAPSRLQTYFGLDSTTKQWSFRTTSHKSISYMDIEYPCN